MNKNYLNILFFSKSGLRLIWPILTITLLIFIGEVLFVDPFGNFLSKIGLSEVTGAIAQNWSDSLGDSFLKNSEISYCSRFHTDSIKVFTEKIVYL